MNTNARRIIAVLAALTTTTFVGIGCSNDGTEEMVQPTPVNSQTQVRQEPEEIKVEILLKDERKENMQKALDQATTLDANIPSVCTDPTRQDINCQVTSTQTGVPGAGYPGAPYGSGVLGGYDGLEGYGVLEGYGGYPGDYGDFGPGYPFGGPGYGPYDPFYVTDFIEHREDDDDDKHNDDDDNSNDDDDEEDDDEDDEEV